MKTTKLLQAFTIISLLFFTGLAASCSEPLISLMFENEETVIRPGLTAEFKCRPVFDDDENREPGRKTLRLFSEPPVVSISNPGFKLLSVNPVSSTDDIYASVIIRAGEGLLSGSSAEITINWAGSSTVTVAEVKKDPAARIDSEGVITDPAAYDALINKNRRLPADYVPEDLVRVEVPTILVFEEVNHLRRAASTALSEMFSAAEAEEGFELLARSGYRSYKTQVMLYDLNVREHGEEYASRFSAQPGTSEHQSGLVMDISSPVVNYQLTQDFGDTDEGRWVAANAHRFGFIIRYPENKEDITGYSYEPWHLRWVGKKIAADCAGGLTLEEYYAE